MSQKEKIAREKIESPLKYILRILSGPIVFAIIQLLPIADLEAKGHLALSVFGWILTWWITQPIPWAITAFLPLVLFPLLDVMAIRGTVALYGQRILPFLMGVMIFGHAFYKHGLAKRFALKLLSIKGLASSGNRIILLIIIATAIVSAVVDDAASVAIFIPIAMSLARAVTDIYSKTEGGGKGAPKFLAACALGVLYGAGAGGLMTPAGVPFNPLAISLLESLTSYRVSFAQWTATGLVLGIVLIILYYFVLRVMSPSEVGKIGSETTEYLAEEKKKLGPITAGERNVLIVFVIMIILWFVPGFFTLPSFFKFLDIWYVPMVGVIILYLLPVNVKKREMTLDSKDFQTGVSWNVLFLVVGGTAIADGLVAVGITDWLTDMISNSMSTGILPWISAVVGALLGNLTSGTATTNIVSTIMFPIGESLGYNSAILARIIAAAAFSITLPWAGAAPGAAFASGEIKMSNMIRCGVVGTIIAIVLYTVLSMLLVPLFGAFTFIG